PARHQAAPRAPVRERRHGGPALAAGGRPAEHDRLAAARQEAQGGRLRRHDHPGGLRPAEGVPAAEPGLAAPVVGRGVAALRQGGVDNVLEPHVSKGLLQEISVMPKDPDKRAKAFQELVRVLEEALQVGADSVGMEYEDGELMVYYICGGTGLAAR